MTDPAQMLTDISRWLPLLGDAHAAILGLHTPRNGRGGGRHDSLPFSLGVVVDTLDDGAPGARTQHGIIQVLTMWADSVAQARHEPRTSPAPTYLATTASWWSREFPDADSLTDDVTTLWTTLARTTGHTDQHDQEARCPACGGTLTRAATPRGLSEWRECSDCQQWYPDADIIDAARHHRLATTDADLWITRDLALQLHPKVSRNLLRQWIHNQRVRTSPGNRDLVSLSDMNRIAA